MAKTIADRVKELGRGWAYRQLVKALEQTETNLTEENADLITETYMRVRRLLYAQIDIYLEIKKSSFFQERLLSQVCKREKSWHENILRKPWLWLSNICLSSTRFAFSF